MNIQALDNKIKIPKKFLKEPKLSEESKIFLKLMFQYTEKESMSLEDMFWILIGPFQDYLKEIFKLLEEQNGNN